MLPNSAPPLASIFSVNVVIPVTETSLLKTAPPPTVSLLPIPTPPSTTNAPVITLVESVAFLILKRSFAENSPLTLTSLLNVTGPSNCDRIVPEFPPSTRILSLTITSSNTTLSLVGSLPVIVGTEYQRLFLDQLQS